MSRRRKCIQCIPERAKQRSEHVHVNVLNTETDSELTCFRTPRHRLRGAAKPSTHRYSRKKIENHSLTSAPVPSSLESSEGFFRGKQGSFRGLRVYTASGLSLLPRRPRLNRPRSPQPRRMLHQYAARRAPVGKEDFEPGRPTRRCFLAIEFDWIGQNGKTNLKGWKDLVTLQLMPGSDRATCLGEAWPALSKEARRTTTHKTWINAAGSGPEH